MKDIVATMAPGTFMARMAWANSGNGVAAVSSTAATIDNQDLASMLTKTMVPS